MASLFQRLFSSEEVEERPAPVVQEVSETGAIETIPVDPESGLIPATKLPSAADALAELFTETDPPKEDVRLEEVRVEDTALPEQASEATVTEIAPKRRGIFARLFAVKRAAKAVAEEVVANDQPAAEAVPSGGEIEAEAVVAAANVEEPEIVWETAASDAAPVAESAAATETVEVAAAAAELPIAIEHLPLTAETLERLFPSENILGEPEPELEDGLKPQPEPETVPEPDSSVSAEPEPGIDVDIEETIPESSTEVATADPVEADADVERAGLEEIAAEEDAGEFESTLELESDRTISEEVAAETETADEDRASETAGESFPSELSKESNTGDVQAGAEVAEPATPAAEPEPPRRSYKDWAFDEKLASHREWVESHGTSGQKADLSGAELEATELISVNLRLADLHDANLRASDLLLADLRDACLVRADLEDACLVGANLEGANLEGASLETAMGLVPRQFAGANLRDALLTPQLMEFEAVPAFERESQNAFRYFVAMTAGSVLSWLVIWKTTDAQLLTDSAVIPFLHSRAAAAALPTAESYLLVPVVLSVLYLVFQFHLQHLWDAVGELPAIFPDGHGLGDRGPGIITGLLRTHFRWMNPDPSSTRLVERGISLFAAYWIVPGTLLLFWARYLTRQEIHGSMLQALLVAITAGIAFHATTKVGRPQEKWALEKKWGHRFVEWLKAANPVSMAAGLGVALMLLSIGIIVGVPHDRGRAPQYGAASIRRWAPNAFWALGFDPYADLTEASISRRPANWTGADDQISLVDGLRMNNSKFRYAQAYRAFLANAHLWHADFQGAFLSDADMRGADLGESNLKFAVMDHAQMAGANLDRSNLDGTDLRRADLRGANLSYSSLEDAVLVDARLDGANLYAAHLISADLTRTNLEKADLREAYLGVAHMNHVDLRGAYLWSAKLPGADMGGGQLGNAILIGADLRGVNLGGAQLSGTVLNDADISGAILEGADLRGALGLTANQVCSAKSRLGALLDDGLASQVEMQCGVAK